MKPYSEMNTHKQLHSQNKARKFYSQTYEELLSRENIGKQIESRSVWGGCTKNWWQLIVFLSVQKVQWESSSDDN